MTRYLQKCEDAYGSRQNLAFAARYSMRFGLLIFLLCSHPLSAWGQVGKDPNIIMRQAGPRDIPSPHDGMTAVRRAQNLGSVTALAVLDHDVFVLDAQQNRVLRLRDQNQDGSMDMRSVFLVGFNNASDMVIMNNDLFISDAKGIWHIAPDKNLAASHRPTNIVSFKGQNTQTPIPLAYRPEDSILFIGINTPKTKLGKIIDYNIITKTTHMVAQGKWQVQDIALTPHGDLWAALQVGSHAQLQHISTQNNEPLIISTTTLENTIIKSIIFWHSYLLSAHTSPVPKISKHAFSYGGIAVHADKKEDGNLIDGFSEAGIVLGKTNVWGSPSALAVLANNKLMFADSINGTLWQLSNLPPKTSIIKKKALKIVTAPKTEVQKKSVRKPPELLHGSSITSASSLSYGSAIGKDDLLKTDKIKPVDDKKKDSKQPGKSE